VRIAGQQIGTQRPPSTGGVLFESLSHETGLVNIVVMPNVYERDGRVIKGEALVLVEGNMEWRTGAMAVQARRVLPLDEALTDKIRSTRTVGFSPTRVGALARQP
jgi:error-prone DNA polymerase